MQGKARKTQDAAHKMSMVNKTKVANEKKKQIPIHEKVTK